MISTTSGSYIEAGISCETGLGGFENAQRQEGVDRILSTLTGKTEALGYPRPVDVGATDKIGCQSLGGTSLVRFLDSTSKLLLQRDQVLNLLLRVGRRRRDTLGEETDPTIPVAAAAETHQLILVSIPAFLEPWRDDEKRLADNGPAQELNDYQQAAEPSVSIGVRMERLELVVGERSKNDRRKIRRRCDPSQQLLDAGAQLVTWWGRYEPRLVKPGAACANDDNTVTKLPSINDSPAVPRTSVFCKSPSMPMVRARSSGQEKASSAMCSKLRISITAAESCCQSSPSAARTSANGA